MIFGFLTLLILAVVFGPQLWVRHVLKRYDRPLPDLPGTGGELAEHLVKRLTLNDVQVVSTTKPDHYNPRKREVALSKRVYAGRSLTAAVIAAHEVGHAIQHFSAYKPMLWRDRIATLAYYAERLGSLLLVTIPIVTAVTRTPVTGAVQLIVGLLVLVFPVLAHLATLPVELDASFKRAMPILAAGYLEEKDLKPARRILMAAALTYVAASLATLLNIARWIQILRR